MQTCDALGVLASAYVSKICLCSTTVSKSWGWSRKRYNDYMIVWISSLLDYKIVSYIEVCLSVSPDWSSITRWRERIRWLWNMRWIHRVATENSDTCDQVAQAVTLRWKALLWGGTLSHQIILNKTRNWDVANGVGSGGDVVNSLSKSHIFII